MKKQYKKVVITYKKSTLGYIASFKYKGKMYSNCSGSETHILNWAFDEIDKLIKEMGR